MFAYVRLVRYVKEMGKNVAAANTLLRAQRELRIVRRTVILVSGLLVTGIPYATFIFISFFTIPPQYHFRIAYVLSEVLSPFFTIILFELTDPLKVSIINNINGWRNTILPMAT